MDKKLEVMISISGNYKINLLSELEIINVIHHTPALFKFILKPSVLVTMNAIFEHNTDTSGYIDNHCDELKLLCIHIRSSSIVNFKNPTEAMQLVAINNDPCNIENIKNPTNKVIMIALRNGYYSPELYLPQLTIDELIEYKLIHDDIDMVLPF